METNKTMDYQENLTLSLGILSKTAREIQSNLLISELSVKQEPAEYIEVDDIPCHDSKHPSESLGPSEFVNYFDSCVLDQLKREHPEDDCAGQSSRIVNSQTVSDNKGSLKFIDKHEIKYEKPENELPLHIKREDENIRVDHLEIKVESLGEQELLHHSEGGTEDACDISESLQKVSKRENRLLKLNKEHEQCKSDMLAGNNKMKLYKCPHCKKYFAFLEHMQDHVRDIHREEKLTCKLCGINFKCNSSLGYHIKNIHAGRIDKSSGSQDYPIPLNLHESKSDQHCSLKRNYSTFRCDRCNIDYKYKYSLDRHIRGTHYYYGRTFKCWCGKHFRTPLLLHSHMSRCHRKKDTITNYQCDYCQKCFQVKQSLIVHIKRIHCDFGPASKCWCGKEFRTPFHLQVHIRLQHGSKVRSYKKKCEYKCERCEVIFKVKQSLTDHINRIHDD